MGRVKALVQANVLELKQPLDGINDIGLGALIGEKLQVIPSSLVGKLREVSAPKHWQPVRAAVVGGLPGLSSASLQCQSGGLLPLH